MIKQQAKQVFEELYGGHIYKAINKDYCAVQLAWSIFTDNLCRNGDITMQQYESWTFPWKRK